MNLTMIISDDGVRVNCECVKGYTFVAVAMMGKSIHITHDFTHTRDNCARFDDSTRLSPTYTVC